MIKPQSALFWIACAAVAAGSARRAGALRALALWCAAGLAVPAAIMGWLAWRGGAGAFLAIATGYVLPLYSRVGRVSVWEGVRWHVYGWQVWSCLIVLGILGIFVRIEKPYDVRRWLALAGAVYGLLHLRKKLRLFVFSMSPAQAQGAGLTRAPTRLQTRIQTVVGPRFSHEFFQVVWVRPPGFA